MKTAISNAQRRKEKARQIFQQGKKQEKKKSDLATRLQTIQVRSFK